MTIAAVTSPTAAYTPDSDRSTDASPAREWNVVQRFGFRFALIYTLLYTYPGPLDALPGAEMLFKPAQALWSAVVPWVGAHVLRMSSPPTFHPSGSGDRVFDWVQIFTMLCLAIVGATIWSAIDRRRHSHRMLFAAFKIYLRFYLASDLFVYGFQKVIPNQMPAISPSKLTEYFGEASPGGFAWTFIGLSGVYERFAGAGEVLAATLLLFRRTSTLGGLVGAAVMTNVFMLNMCFDIPVKQYSFHLLLGCAVLAALDAPRLLNVFVRERAAEAPRHTELFATPTSRRVARLVAIALASGMIGSQLRMNYRVYHEYGPPSPRGPLYGVFEVEQVVKNGVVDPGLLTDSTRWRRVSVDRGGAVVRLATDARVGFQLSTDTVKRSATFGARSNGPKFSLAYAFPDTEHLTLRGRMGADSVEMTLRRRPESSFLLVGRGFHWVNEFPVLR
jgi:hypothetical protein